ncbi:hypothetical protein B0H65DRAFT_445059 [Neurospora tetraspora]|uniref:Uncharacterized protein n=1 Tax=Neurospora tetraspora TaxID=94610 RepID=A0AAE0J8X2_9PEZI|nr:hypothetical protein B0H65DRAFT_445059 [Neurospora tetraspora]
MAGNRRGGGMKIDLPPVPLGVVVAFMEPTYPKPIPPESYNPFDIAFDLERGFQGRFQSKEDFEAKKREYLARRNGQGKAQVDLVKYPGCLDDLPITEADRNVWRKKLFGATTSGCWGEIQQLITMEGNSKSRGMRIDRPAIIRDDRDKWCKEILGVIRNVMSQQDTRMGQSTKGQAGGDQGNGSVEQPAQQGAPVPDEETHVGKAMALDDEEIKKMAYEFLDELDKAHLDVLKRDFDNVKRNFDNIKKIPSFAARWEAYRHALRLMTANSERRTTS